MVQVENKMKDIAIFGAGGLGREVACIIQKINEVEPTWNLVGFFDDDPKLKDQMVSHHGKCFGGIDALNSYDKELALAIAVGSPRTVQIILSKITNSNISYPNIIHPNFVIADDVTFKLGKGNIIQRDCKVSCDVTLGDFNMLNGNTSMGHDVVVGSFNTFMPAARISGMVKIGDLNFFGVGCIVLQGLKIGNNTKIGAGSVLMTKPKEGYLYLGVPAKKTEF